MRPYRYSSWRADLVLPNRCTAANEMEIEMLASAMTFLDRTAVTLVFLLAASPMLGIAARAAFI